MKPQIISEDALSLITKAEIDTQISTAKAFPRNLQQSIINATQLATMSQEVAESCVYVLPRSGKTIEGPSVRLAEIVVSTFGNMRSGARVIANDGVTITAQGICHDLETNNSVTIEVKRSIQQHEWKNGQKTGKMVTMNADMQVVTGNAACAIAFRNAVFKVIPAALTIGIYDKVKDCAKGKIEDITLRRNSAVTWFSKKRVTKVMICEHFDVKEISEIDLDMLAKLTGYKSAIVNDGADVKEIFAIEKKKSVDNKKEGMRAKKAEESKNSTDKDGQNKLDMK